MANHLGRTNRARAVALILAAHMGAATGEPIAPSGYVDAQEFMGPFHQLPTTDAMCTSFAAFRQFGQDAYVERRDTCIAEVGYWWIPYTYRSLATRYKVNCATKRAMKQFTIAYSQQFWRGVSNTIIPPKDQESVAIGDWMPGSGCLSK